MGALIEYEFYTKEEIRPYFEKVFDEYIMPVIQKGKKQLLENLKFYADSMDDEEIEAVLEKINS